jgi:hypothetical protein
LANSDNDKKKRDYNPKHHPKVRRPHVHLMPEQVACGESQENDYPEGNYS